MLPSTFLAPGSDIPREECTTCRNIPELTGAAVHRLPELARTIQPQPERYTNAILATTDATVSHAGVTG
jgi:hypothetical protein